ncbi:LexA family protein [Megasphaera vaginalis (ex Srinivasan et al. 2021)]|uniref:DNA-binding helix-turn-helix protein n=1 Tax=Megasphaera vaginalis (ex Srinivasan et al. 2021) TaxID=1111454 RepID=U7UQP4_9FIRM|nr:S24 family peptidase [Megasphaera vaginalis (ex Srinivasan et al. 2021)]ERT60788.1 DNA-binding helix-turn-helix protein [Megasphaera vaginalis (ex Srinivasan et al. 2021)]
MNGKRLKKLREENGFTQKDLADKLKLTPKAISFYELESREPSGDALVNMAKIFGVTTDYLLGNSDFPLSNEIEPPKDNKQIPIIGTVTCGPNGLAYEYIDGTVAIDSSLYGDIRAFHCKGDSMIGLGIFDGDIAIARMQNDIESGELAIVIINGDEGTLKRVRKADSVIVLESANPEYPPRIFAGKEANKVRIVGKVIEVRKSF